MGKRKGLRQVTMDVKEIVIKHLEANDFDGLVNTTEECGCEIKNLVPCESGCSECKPAYKHFHPDSYYGWDMFEKKEPPTYVEWERL